RTNRRESCPAGMARVQVRGLAASMSASAQRLKAMAQERAAIMATRIQRSVRRAGRPPAARMAAVSANGSAKMECSHLIISSVVRVLARRLGMVEPKDQFTRSGERIERAGDRVIKWSRNGGSSGRGTGAGDG